MQYIAIVFIILLHVCTNAAADIPEGYSPVVPASNCLYAILVAAGKTNPPYNKILNVEYAHVLSLNATVTCYKQVAGVNGTNFKITNTFPDNAPTNVALQSCSILFQVSLLNVVTIPQDQCSALTDKIRISH